LVEVFAEDFVHGNRTAQHPAPLIGNTKQLQEALDGAVLSQATMKDDQRNVNPGSLLGEPGQIVAGVVAQDFIAPLVELLKNLLPAVQRDLAFR